MQLFHFSEESGIAAFVPKAVAIPASRPAGMEWLNGPLVWAIDDWHQPMYLFPRDCPRILIWPTATTTLEDRRAYSSMSHGRMIAYIEWPWLQRLSDTILYRYTLPSDGFVCLHDAGMWVSRSPATPTEVQEITSLPAALEGANVELRVVPSLEPIKALRRTTLHVSMIRLRNMQSPRDQADPA